MGETQTTKTATVAFLADLKATQTAGNASWRDEARRSHAIPTAEEMLPELRRSASLATATSIPSLSFLLTRITQSRNCFGTIQIEMSAAPGSFVIETYCFHG